MKLRVKFSKHGPIRFIGHLDIMRYFQKAVRRSGIPVCYSQGFSPHQIMSFAAPLGVGIESEGEYFDMEVESVSNESDMVKSLNDAMAEGMEIKSMRILPEKAQNAMASIKAASYRVKIRNGAGDGIDFKQRIDMFLKEEEILYEKETKKGSVTRNIRPCVYELSLLENGELYMLVDASSAGNLKPGAVVECLYRYGNETYQSTDLLFTRIDAFTENEEHELISLGEVGDKF